MTKEVLISRGLIKEGVERVSLRIFETDQVGSIAVAEQIAKVIRTKEEKGEMAILGLATGSSPIKVYR